MEIQYTKGDATDPKTPGNKVIVHICNDVGGWGAGFVLAISKRWKEPEQSYRAWYKNQAEGAPPFELGEVQFVQVKDDLWVANLIGQYRLSPEKGIPPIRYDAVEQGLTKVADWAKEHNASVHMPRIGCGLAGGKWEEIGPIVEKTLAGLEVTVYDFR
jgi:O-acetyl-ADP-ribose deacetylase (regulator of RNase III)